MTPKVNYYEQIEDYCLDQLIDEAKLQFEAELKLDAELRSEVKLRMEVDSAIAEKDITNLRDLLKNVATQSATSNSPDESFELIDGFSDIHEISEELSSEELINYFESMPKVHVHQHEMTSNENIHQFYKEQDESADSIESEELIESDLEDFEGLEEAILEKDIINFRQTLSQVAKSVEPQFTVEEIDDFINDELSGEELQSFEKELSNNSDLKAEIELHKDLENAIQENEILNLRSQVSQIMESETSWNVSEKDIEAFIEGDLDDDHFAEFNAELEENSDLMAEVELRKQINEVVGELDIHDLRSALVDAQESIDTSTVRNIIPEVNNKLYKFLRTSVAVIVVLIGVAGVLNSGYLSVNNAYEKFYETPTWSAERAITVDISFFNEVQNAYSSKNHLAVLDLKETAPKSSLDNPVIKYYYGASNQKLDNYTEAISNFSQVINHGDNMFIEEAEWYRSLCYMKIGDRAQATQELLGIVEKKGYFKDDAKAVLRRLKFTLE